MHLQIDEQLDLWQAVQAVQLEQSGVSDNAFQEIDNHFAEVQSWHAELTAPKNGAQQVSVPAVGKHDRSGNGHSNSVPLRGANGTAARLLNDETQAFRKQLAAERELLQAQHMSRCDARCAAASACRRRGGLYTRPPGLARLAVAGQLSPRWGKPSGSGCSRKDTSCG